MNERIKELRISLGMTQDDFGKKIGLARKSIANYEIGRRVPSNAVITSICQEFNINEILLRTGDGRMKNPINTEYEVITTLNGEKYCKAKQAIIDYWILSEYDKKLFWQFIDRFFKEQWTNPPVPFLL